MTDQASLLHSVSVPIANSRLSATLTVFQVFFDLVHEHGIDRLFNGREDVEYAIQLGNFDQFGGVVREAGKYKDTTVMPSQIARVNVSCSAS